MNFFAFVLTLLFTNRIMLVISKCDNPTQYTEYNGEINGLNKFNNFCSACLGYTLTKSQIECNFVATVPCDNVIVTVTYLLKIKKETQQKTCEIQSDINAFGSDEFTSSVFNDKYPLHTEISICVNKNDNSCKFSLQDSQKPKPKTKNMMTLFFGAFD